MDLRKPSGYFFMLLGCIVALAGIASPDIQAPLSDKNVNLWCGVAMLAFGGILLLLARRAES